MSRVLLFFLLIASVGVTAQSNIYRTVDEHGNVVFTDTPPATGVSSETVDVPPTNSAAPPPDISPRAAIEKSEDESADAQKVQVSISAPANETTIPMGPGNFDVTANVQPALGKEQSLQLLLDGEPQGEPQANGSWALSNVFRGQHDLTVQVLDAEREVVATSEPVRVYVQRPTINNQPAAPRPPPAVPARPQVR